MYFVNLQINIVQALPKVKKVCYNYPRHNRITIKIHFSIFRVCFSESEVELDWFVIALKGFDM